MNPPESFLWHDYETFGAQAMYDRPAQFAAQRTDAELQPIGEPLSWFCAPADDVLPHPTACLITGITPQQARRDGLVETEFAARILEEMMRPGTCSAGYNSIRFDDVFTRNLLYRNLRDPYEREYLKGNSRWDLIDLARMYYALRPEGVQWPKRAASDPDNTHPEAPSFKLEDLTRANGIEHSGAHEALADVHASIALARLLKNSQPRLWDWGLGLRDQKTAMALLDPNNEKAVLHTSARIAATRGCTTLVLPIAVLTDRPKSVVAFDLMADPDPLIELSADAIADLVFTSNADLPEGMERLPLKTIHSNHVPMLAPESTLQETDTARIQLDQKRCSQHAEILLRSMATVRPKVIEVFSRSHDQSEGTVNIDPDQMLYSGGFFSAGDKHLMRKILGVPPEELPGHVWTFKDERLPLMLFRYRARNFPETLSSRELEIWDSDRARRLVAAADSQQLSMDEFKSLIANYRISHADDANSQRILDQLESWVLETGLERLWKEHSLHS